MNIERGDSVKFGEKWCNKYKRFDLVNQVIKFTPQWFEEDNGLFTTETECPGIDNGEDGEPDSIYHLFGNNFENFMDCELIKGTEQDKEEYDKIIRDKNEAEEKYWAEYLAKVENC